MEVKPCITPATLIYNTYKYTDVLFVKICTQKIRFEPNQIQ